MTRRKKSLLQNDLLRFIIGGTIGLTVALLISFNALLLWVASGPRSLNKLTPYIEAAFRSSEHNYSVKVGETWLIWDGWRHPIDIRLRDVSVLTGEGQTFSTFPEISLGVDVLSLMRGRVLPTSIGIARPVISLFQNDDRSISFGFHKEPSADAPPGGDVPFGAVMVPLLMPDNSSNLRKLRVIHILNADVSVGNRKKGVFFKASGANIVFNRDRHGMVQAESNAKITYGKYQSLISLQLTLNKDQPDIRGEVTVGQLMPGVLAALFSDNPVINAVKVPINATARFAVDKEGILKQIDFAVEGGKGTIESDMLSGSLPVSQFHVEGKLGNQGTTLQIDLMTANLDGIGLAGDGIIGLGTEEQMGVKGRAIIKNVPASMVHLFWPPKLSPESREWITTNITEGMVTQAEARINIMPGDFPKPVLPKESVDAAITLEGGKVRYLPEHPEIRNVKGVIHVDGLSLRADIESGDYMKQTKLSHGKVLIEDLNADNPYIKVSLNADTGAKDVVKFLGLPKLRHAARLGLSEDTAEGSIKGVAQVGFNFYAPRDAKGKPIGEPDVDYDVTADVKGVSQSGFMKRFDIKNAEGTFTAKNSGISFKGKGNVNDASASEAGVRYLFKPENGFDTFIDATGVAPVEALPRFGYLAFPFLKGIVGVKASIKQGDAQESSQASIDLTRADIDMKDIGLNKPEGEPATLELTAEKKDGMAKIPSFHFKGKEKYIKGSMDLDKDLTSLRRVVMEKAVYGRTDLDSVLYEVIEGGYRIEAKGKSADISSWLNTEEDPQAESTFSFEHFPALHLKADIGHMIMGKERELKNFQGEVSCSVKLCSSATVTAKTIDDKPVTFRIFTPPGGKRQLSLRAESAGAFLRAINAFDGMEGGDLAVTGSYTDSEGSSSLKGRANINEYTMKNAPVLAKILSLASLSGFFDTLQGNGIRFTKLRAPFTIAKDVVTLREAKTHGDALGMTIEGTITFPKRTLDLHGTIVPSYTLNNVLGKVPLVGNLLTGGEGQGVFATRYSVKGQRNNPEVMVNPLSMLTPGFLRGLFDIFDAGEKKDEEDGQ